jgi:uncharacterized protein YqjF (DUF2071 family)
MAPYKRVFLTAEWRYLAMLNYAIDPALLADLIPEGTEVDSFEGRTYVSLVGFRFIRTRVLGFGIPFHQDFDEVNLRFYVRRRAGSDLRRGVVFVREIVPRRAIADVARFVFNEKYVALPMSHRIADTTPASVEAEYRWRHKRRWCALAVSAEGQPAKAADGSLEQFITEHYWGYSAQRRGGTLEYEVAHPSWKVWTASSAHFEGNVDALYGAGLAAAIARKPDSAFLANGSAVTVYRGVKI